MAMTTSELSIKVSSDGIAKATTDLKNLSAAAASVDAETKSFVIAQQKLNETNKNSSKSSEAAARGVTSQELSMIKAHEAVLKMNASVDRQIAAQERLNNSVAMSVRGITNQELAMVKAHEQALKMNKAFDDKAKHLDNLNSKGSIWNNTLKSMAVAASAYIGVNFAMGVIKQADAWAMMQSKLLLATGSMNSAKVVQKDLFDLSQKLRIPLEDAAQLYTRMSHPMMMMGKTTKDTMQMVESLGTALKLSGATGQEASSAMLQFSQSMNAGRLNGGEFNSIAEASPNILRAIEAELRRTGQWGENTTETLKKMGSEGKISSELLARSLQNALPQMRKDFEKLPLTFDGAMERIKNAWLKAVGEMGQDTNFTKEFAKSLASLEESLPKIANMLGVAFNFVAQNLGTIVSGIGTLVGLGVASWAYSSKEALMGMATVLRLMTASALAFMATPIGMAIAAITVTVGAGIYAYDKYTESQEASKKAAEDLGRISPDIVKSLEAEHDAALKQYKVLFKIKEVKDELAAQGQVSEIDKANAEVMDLVAKAQAAIKSDNKENIEMYQAKLKIAAVELGRLKTLNSETMALQKVNGLEAERQANAKRVQELFDKYADNTEKRDKELAKLKELTLTEKQRAELTDKINKKFEDKTPDKYKSLKESTVAYSNTLEELKQKYIELQKFGVDDKRTTSEKEYTRIQLEYSQATDKVVKAEKAKQLAIAQSKVVQENLINVETKRQKDFQDTLDSYVKEADATDKSAEKQEMLLEAYGKTEGELYNLRMIKEENKLLDMAQRGLNDELLTQQQHIVDNLRRESKARDMIGDQKALEDSKKVLDDLFDTSRVDKFENSSTKALKGVIKGFAELNKALNTYGVKQEKIAQARRANLEMNYGDFKKFSDQEAAITNKEVDYKLASYADMAEAAKNFFNEGSKGYQAMDAVSKVYHAAQMARNLTEMAMMATKGVMNQAAGDVYTAIPRMAAMAAIMAGLGFATGMFGSSGGGGMKAEDVQKTQGTGSVFGDSAAKSESIKKSLELLKASYDKLYPVNQGMLRALKNIESSMTGLSNLVLRSGGVIEGTNMGIATGQLNAKGSPVDAISSFSTTLTKALFGSSLGGSIAKFINNLWGKVTQTIVDSGIQFGGSLAAMQAGKGFNQYASVDTTKSSWFGLKKDTSNSIQTQGLSDELASQFGLVFTNMQKSLEEAGKALYGTSKGVTDALDSLVLSTSKISLKGLSGQALTDAINAVISKGLDEMAQAAFANFDQYRQVGEGYAQTIMRVANNFVTVNAVFDKLGMKLLETSDAGIKASDSFIKLFDSLEEMQSVAAEYYDKFYTEQEKQAKITEALKKQFEAMNLVMPDSIKAYRELVDNTTDPEKIATLWRLSGAFAEVFSKVEEVSKELPQIVKDAFDSLSKDAQRWLAIRNQAASLQDSIQSAMGNPQKDPAIRMQQLWDAMSKDVTPEQKLELAGQLKDLMLSKYQLEKDNMLKLIDFGKQLRTYVESLKVGALSPLTVGQKLAEAQAQYQATLAKAQGGDTAAQGMLQGKADTYLQLAQTALASSGGYTDIFNNVTNSLDSLGIESMSAAEQANQLASGQLDELKRLSEFVAGLENTADVYYNSSLTALSTQISLMDAMYQKMGIFDGMLSSIASLPAEIAASLSGKATSSVGNDEFIRALYQSVEGRVGAQIDQAGYQYWMKDLQTQSREQVGNNFIIASAQNAQANTNPTANLEARISELTTEVANLRADQKEQTGALIDAAIVTSANSTDAIVTATKESAKSSKWDSEFKAELV